MSLLEVFQMAFLIISVTFMSGLVSLVSTRTVCNIKNFDQFMEKCKEQSSYSLTEQQSLRIDLYYDAGGMEPDYSFVGSMCKARKLFKHVTFSFFVGVSVKRGKNGSLECLNSDIHDTSCTYAFLDACASKLVPDFAKYVCCTYTDNDTSTVQECFQKQNANLAEFENCSYPPKHPNIRADEILLENSKKAHAVYHIENCFPLLTFNGKTDICARNIFINDPEKVICAMLAKGVEKECDK